MKHITFNPIETLREHLPGHRVDAHAIVEHASSGVVLYPRPLDEQTSDAQVGDLIVQYADAEALASQYRRAVRALELDEAIEARYLDLDRLESFQDDLKRQLTKVKLWNYAPQKRDDVRAARLFLRHYLNQTIPYGTMRTVHADEMEAFLMDEACRFGVARYYYAVEPASALHLSDAVEGIVALGKAAETQVESTLKQTLKSAQHLTDLLYTHLPKEVRHHGPLARAS